MTFCLVNVTVGGSGRKSFQYWVPRLGVTSGPGYLGTVETSIPLIVQISNIMIPTWDSLGCWKERAAFETWG